MDLLDLPQLANQSGLPLSLTRYYRDRFILFVPSVRIGRNILHPSDAVDVMITIRDHAATGLSADAIQAALEQIYPVTVINAQELPDGAGTGATGAIRALAAAIDDRGLRIEAEVAMLRAQIAEAAAAKALPTPEPEGPVPAAPTAEQHAAELQSLRATIEELRAHISLLASREQLEWIGDVVAAAALRPPQGAVDAAIDRRLLDLQEQVQQLRGTQELGPLREAIDRLAMQTGGREKEMHRAFQTLIGAVRKEIAAVHLRLAELKTAINAGEHLALADDFSRLSANGHIVIAGVEANGTESHVERSKSRAPRRLGQPLRGGAPVDHDDAPAVEQP
jgi:DNA-binding transcriptional MerR regulator